MKSAATLFVLIALSALLIAEQAGQQLQQDKLLALADSYTSADSLEIVMIKDYHLIKYNNDQGIPSFFLQSCDFCQINGYNGVSNLAVILDSAFVIQQVEIISSPDTPAYLRLLKRNRFLNQFHSYDGHKAIKTVSGATVTSSAILKTLQNVLNVLKN